MARAKAKKKSRVSDWIYRIIMLILFGVMAFSGFRIFSIYRNYNQGTSVYEEVAETVIIDDRDSRLDIDWDRLKEINSEVKGWIRLPGTVINYPIAQGYDNDYYLSRLIDGTWNDKGTLFIDYQCRSPFMDFLTIIYGHRMRDKSMFYLLGEYLEDRESPYFLDHPVMEIYTPNKNYDLQIFAAGEIDSRDGNLYNFAIYADSDIQDYVNRVSQQNALVGYDNRVIINPGDKIIMLSTCTLRGSANDDNRVVVWGKLVEVD